MYYKDIRENIKKMANDNYKDFIKAIVGIEKGIDDEKALEEIYDKYMENDTSVLLSEGFDYMIDEMKEQGKIVENENSIEEKDDLVNLVGNIVGEVKNLKLYKFVSQLPSDIKWAYIPQKSLIASNNPYLRMELLEAGISIVDQMPLDVDQIKDCVKIANNKKVYYIPEIPSENDIFFKQCTNTIYEEFSKNNILYIDGLFSKFLIYYIFKILKEGLKTNQKVNITNNHGNSMIKSFSGYIASVPFCIRIYRPNLNEEYQFTAYNDELKIFTKIVA